ncbi:eukaryotic translation initiation factor 2-alpha kinase 1-like isoform X2 [Chelonus insularis]|uniref:eukaryotic translation initiation factor 2-alpha kinase 1-like isoform X2 n=1 Tax=Chelonus insularis TaxID=460826 RepID=UPI00158C70B0|nr:eukaryotic translation initiation factor 2-alpha kinase 1-like isoform X2 [Chelonus insularis]
MEGNGEHSSWSDLLNSVSTENESNTDSANSTNNQPEMPSDDQQIIERSVSSRSLIMQGFLQQVCTMFEDDPVKRNKLYFDICDKLHAMKLIDKSYDMDEFENLRGQCQRILYNLVSGSRKATGCGTIVSNPKTLANQSRYRDEFEELDYLASGGFGHVFKARHRLDKNEYAIKKICVSSGKIDEILKHLEEVEKLAKLNHPNIVSYKGAWIEEGPPVTRVPCLLQMGRSNSRSSNKTRSIKKQLETSNSDRNSLKSIQARSKECEQKSSFFSILETNNKMGTYLSDEKEKHSQQNSGTGILSSHDIVSERFQQLNSTTTIIGRRIEEQISSSVVAEVSSDIVSFRNEENGLNEGQNNTSTSSDIEEMDSSDEAGESEWNQESSSRQVCEYNLSTNQATLYIQMALCEQTLRQWLDERQESTSISTITAILMQILNGLDYIHSNSIVHHDIKPSNIFISPSRQLHVQLGDFGLACLPKHKNCHPIVGTHLYAAPEQLKGLCDPKSDVYSMGIVLLELLVPTRTQHERITTIDLLLKAGKIPDALYVHCPKWIEMIKALVDKDPARRPSTKELLQNLSEDKDMIIAKLKNDNKKKDEIICKLQHTIKELQDKISKYESTVNAETTSKSCCEPE